jgi:hypothetical protein
MTPRLKCEIFHPFPPPSHYLLEVKIPQQFVLAHADAPAAAFTIAISSKPIQTFASTIRPEEGTIGSNTKVGK